MTTDLVPFIAKRWRDAIVAVTLIAFAAGGFVARAVIGFDPILSLCLAFAVGLIADLAAGSVAGAFAQECVTRDELRRRLDAEASPSFAQNATIIGGCASAAFLVLGLWKYPPQDLAILLFLIVAAVSGGGVFGFYCALAMRQVERWAASEARRPARRRLHLTVFETISFFLFFWSTSIAAGLGVSGLFDARDKASGGGRTANQRTQRLHHDGDGRLLGQHARGSFSVDPKSIDAVGLAGRPVRDRFRRAERARSGHVVLFPRPRADLTSTRPPEASMVS